MKTIKFITKMSIAVFLGTTLIPALFMYIIKIVYIG